MSLRRVDIASLGAFRILFGSLMLVATVRFVAHGWIHDEFLNPHFFFPYWGFEWVRPWPGAGMHVHYAVMGVSALFVTIGYRYRASVAVFGLLFTYAHLVDRTNYLNHYHLVSCLSLSLFFLPLDRTLSVRTWRRPHEAWDDAPGWCLWLLRLQVGSVYFFGGVGKLGADWMLHAQPLSIWLSANTDFPVIGALFARKATAFAFSWGGAAFDLTIPALLLFRPTRRLAFVVLVFFHVITARLLPIGMFPWIMIAAATVFLDPGWPRRKARALPAVGRDAAPRWLVAWAAVQVLVPLRALAYPGSSLWTEEGFRFSWRVMLMEKSGTLEMSTVDRNTGAKNVVDLREWLTPLQLKMASTQPDMILTLAHAIGEGKDVEVHAEALVSLNGRRAHGLVDPAVDLMREHEGFAPKRWILPAPDEAPGF